MKSEDSFFPEGRLSEKHIQKDPPSHSNILQITEDPLESAPTSQMEMGDSKALRSHLNVTIDSNNEAINNSVRVESLERSKMIEI